MSDQMLTTLQAALQQLASQQTAIDPTPTINQPTCRPIACWLRSHR